MIILPSKRVAWSHDSYTKMLLHLDGSDASTTFTDSIGTHTPAAGAGTNAQIDTAYQKFGTGSLLLDGTGDRLEVADHDDFSFGTGDFTIDFWVRFNTFPANGDQIAFVSQYVDSSNYWYCLLYNNLGTYRIAMAFVLGGENKGTYTTDYFALNTNQWYHLAFERSGTSAYIFIDGDSCALTETVAFGTNDVGALGAVLEIGARSTGLYLNGWMDELRISKGIARWTSNFTPPSVAYR